MDRFLSETPQTALVREERRTSGKENGIDFKLKANRSPNLRNGRRHDMTITGSNYMVIKVETETGKVVEVADENGKPATKMDPKEVQEIYNSKNGFRHVGVVLHAHQSPGCVYYSYGGWVYRICR
jgi:hypothetical protein